nr:hypothetical protein [uncultured Flavobacterium sp.]
MSRSNPQDSLANPAKKFISWSGEEGNFNYWDKEAKKKVVIEIGPKKPFLFLWLDALSTIKGYSDSAGSGFWSNEVRKLDKEPLTVRTKEGIVCKGLYANIKDSVTAKGAKFCQSVYVAMKGDDGKLEICNLQLYGAALTAWIEFVKGKKLSEIAVKVTSSLEQKKGKTVYRTPVFEVVPTIKEETNAQAIELDKELQEFLKAYLDKNASDTSEPETVADKAEVTKGQPTASRSKLEENTNFANEANEVANDIISGMASDEEPF